jgi:hypothetical protein
LPIAVIECPALGGVIPLGVGRLKLDVSAKEDNKMLPKKENSLRDGVLVFFFFYKVHLTDVEYVEVIYHAISIPTAKNVNVSRSCKFDGIMSATSTRRRA